MLFIGNFSNSFIYMSFTRREREGGVVGGEKRENFCFILIVTNYIILNYNHFVRKYIPHVCLVIFPLFTLLPKSIGYY